MAAQHTRREILKGTLAVAGLAALGIPEWALPALAQGETLVPFTDLPDNVYLRRRPDRRLLDIRTIDGPFTPKRPVLHDAALRPSGGRSGDVPAEGLGLVNGRCRCRSTTCARCGAPSSWPASNARATAGRCRVCAATAAGPACR